MNLYNKINKNRKLKKKFVFDLAFGLTEQLNGSFSSWFCHLRLRAIRFAVPLLAVLSYCAIGEICHVRQVMQLKASISYEHAK